MAVYWASPKNSVTSLSRDSHVTKISKSYSERTIRVRAYCSHTWKLSTMAVYWASRKNPVTSSSRDSHVIKISKSYSERTIAVRPYYSHRGVNPEATVGFAYDLGSGKSPGTRTCDKLNLKPVQVTASNSDFARDHHRDKFFRNPDPTTEKTWKIMWRHYDVIKI